MITKAARIALCLGALALAACDSGYTTQQAVAACDIERESKSTLTDEAYAACVACFEQCGDDCESEGTTPENYACPQ